MSDFTNKKLQIGLINVAKPLPLLVGLTRIELVTSSLSGMRSNQLSYSPDLIRGT